MSPSENPPLRRRRAIAFAASVEPCSWLVLISISSLKIDRASSRSAAGEAGVGGAAIALADTPKQISAIDADSDFFTAKSPPREMQMRRRTLARFPVDVHGRLMAGTRAAMLRFAATDAPPGASR